MATETPPFKVGDRVRVKHGTSPHIKYREGVVKSVRRSVATVDEEVIDEWWYVVVKRKGHSDHDFWAPDGDWEVVPVDDMTTDETCQQLVAAYHRGDTAAALALADRIFELCGGTRTVTTGAV